MRAAKASSNAQRLSTGEPVLGGQLCISGWHIRPLIPWIQRPKSPPTCMYLYPRRYTYFTESLRGSADDVAELASCLQVSALVIAKIISLECLPKSDKLKKCKISIGNNSVQVRFHSIIDSLDGMMLACCFLLVVTHICPVARQT